MIAPDQDLWAEYWSDRRNLKCYKYVQSVVNIFDSEAASAIDVGAGPTPLIEISGGCGVTMSSISGSHIRQRMSGESRPIF
jgi:hypothetical protein